MKKETENAREVGVVQHRHGVKSIGSNESPEASTDTDAAADQPAEVANVNAPTTQLEAWLKGSSRY